MRSYELTINQIPFLYVFQYAMPMIEKMILKFELQETESVQKTRNRYRNNTNAYNMSLNGLNTRKAT